MRNSYVASRPGFIVDHQSIDRHDVQIAWDAWGEEFRSTPGVVVTVGAAGAAIGAVSIPVAALTGPIAAGTVLRFSADEFATVSVAAAAGATDIDVEALVTAVESGDVATVPGVGSKLIPAGTVFGRDVNGKAIPRVETTAPAMGLLATDAVQDDRSAALSGHGAILGGLIYEDLLPAVPSAAVKAELAAAGTGFGWRPYADTRSS